MKKNLHAFISDSKQPVWIVTGASGYLGSHFLQHVLETNNHKYIGIDTVSSNFSHINYMHIEETFSSEDLQESLFFFEEIVGVIHLAAKKNLLESFMQTYEYYEVNTFQTLKFFHNAQKRFPRRFIFASSAAVYTDPITPTKLYEHSATVPQSPYGISKRAAEIMLESCPNLKGTICLRFFNLAGDSIGKWPSAGIVNIVSNARVFGEKVAINFSQNGKNSLECSRDYVSVWDAVKAIESSMDVEPIESFEVFNVASGVASTMQDVLVSAEVSKSPLQTYKRESRNKEAEYIIGDYFKFFQKSGWLPTFDLKQTILKTIATYEGLMISPNTSLEK